MADPPRGVQVVGKVLPVDFRAADEALRVALEGVWALKPVALLSLGVQRRPYYRLERLARARLDSKKTDAAGILARDLEPRGRGVRQTCLDLERLVAVLTAAGAGDARISSDAGGFLCEFVYYGLLGAAEARGLPAVFLHLPPVDVVAVEDQIPVLRALVAELARGAAGE